MARKNLSARTDMAPDVLRQRRDFYAIALGLLLFQLAHGTLGESNTVSNGLLPIKFENPCWFIRAAWIGFAYFLVRYTLMAPSAWGSFRDDALQQAGASRAGRNVAIRMLDPQQSDKALDLQRHLLRTPNGPYPRLVIQKLRVRYSGIHIPPGAPNPGFHTVSEQTDRDSWILAFAFLRGLLTATWRERAFTDYVLPYIVGATTICVAVGQWLSGRTHFCW